MATKTKPTKRAITLSSDGKFHDGITLQAPLTMEEHMLRIEALGQRIDGYIRFMCQLATQSGISLEAKERAVHAFYKQMVLVEGQLGRIHNELQLE